MSRWTRVRIWIVIVLALVIYLLTRFGVTLYTDFLWFQHLNLQSVFLTTLWAKIWVGLAVAIPFALIFLVNIMIARWQSVRSVLFFKEETLVAQKFVVWVIWGVTLFFTWIVGTAASANWLQILSYFNQQPFGLADPVFNMDVSFYFFSLPFFHFGQTWLIIVLFLSLLGALAVYALAQQNNLQEGRIVILPYVQLHLSMLGALIFLTFAVGHWLGMYDLMYSARGVAFGASYVDINITLPALWLMIGVAIAAALLLVLNAFLRRSALSLGAVSLWIITGIVATGFVPGIIQRYVVEPNELARETPYIQNNINYTNAAYGLNRVREQEFPPLEPLTQANLDENQATLRNIRLWDYRPLLQTYRQIQAIRLYYSFFDIDMDRYMIDGELRQVALSARELDKSQLQSATWVTQKLQFTHGYGVVVNPVDQVTGDGLPRLWVKDLPPISTSADLTVTRPEIYYGEITDDYVFVNTTEREFNYPSGDENIYTNYEGTGGVVMNSYFKKLAFALRLSDMNMLLSQEFTPQSRVMLYRNIKERVRQVAPFLEYDRDPYLVIAPDGRLYWIQDAYTTSDRFPYAQPIGNLNYIRNSVKVVIDAYNGSLTFYMVDADDPLLKTYAAIFPALFTPGSQVPDWVRDHFRYPEDMFRIQSTLYQTYHMSDVNVFYNKEDLWQVPMEIFSGNTQPVEPYYVIVRSPGEADSEFVLIQPFTPNNKDNLIAWMAGRSDGEHYGELAVYRFPKQELIFGPLQIESRIDQNPEISAQITLWSQGGSDVIRGNLLVLPMNNSLLYVEPLYLRAEQGQIPELKRVIMASGDRIVMRETLAEAFTAFFAGEAASMVVPAESESAAPAAEQPGAPLSDDVATLAETAAAHYEAAETALRQGDWATYGQELDNLKAALDRLIELTGAE